jgi:hypothetical protein
LFECEPLVQDNGQGQQRIEAAQIFVNRIDRGIFGTDFREIFAKCGSRGAVKLSTDVRALVGEFITTEGRIFDNMILLAVIDNLHAAIR